MYMFYLVGSEELLLWCNHEPQVQVNGPTTGWFSSAISTINSTLDKVLTIEHEIETNIVDDQF